jgi:broad specificity phosphatase PhoE
MARMSLPSPVSTFVLALFVVLGAGHPRAALRTDPKASAVRADTARTVVLVRHAEKGSDDPRDPTLSDAGRERAADLARLLARSGARRLFASEFRRTHETLAPLAAELGLEVERVPAGELEALVAELSALAPGTTAVVAGHSNTVPALAARLGVTLPALEAHADGARLAEAEYDRLFVVTLPPAGTTGAALAPSVLELAYGRPSP